MPRPARGDGIRLAGDGEGQVTEHLPGDVVDAAVHDFEAHAVRGKVGEDVGLRGAFRGRRA
jgi:hypothetical protein